MATVSVLRRQTGRAKHGKTTNTEYDFSHEIENATVRYVSTENIDTHEIGTGETSRSGASIDVNLTVPSGSDVTAQDRVELDDGDVYRIDGKPQPRKNGLTGTTFRTLIHLVRIEG